MRPMMPLSGLTNGCLSPDQGMCGRMLLSRILVPRSSSLGREGGRVPFRSARQPVGRKVSRILTQAWRRCHVPALLRTWAVYQQPTWRAGGWGEAWGNGWRWPEIHGFNEISPLYRVRCVTGSRLAAAWVSRYYWAMQARVVVKTCSRRAAVTPQEVKNPNCIDKFGRHRHRQIEMRPNT